MFLAEDIAARSLANAPAGAGDWPAAFDKAYRRVKFGGPRPTQEVAEAALAYRQAVHRAFAARLRAQTLEAAAEREAALAAMEAARVAFDAVRPARRTVTQEVRDRRFAAFREALDNRLAGRSGAPEAL